MIRLSVVLVVACGSATPPPAPTKPAADARAYELGRGVKRDYKMAARLLDDRCKAGCGDEPTCHELLVLELHERGFVGAIDTVSLAVTQCDRGDKMGCFVAVLVGERPPTSLGDSDATRAACIDKHDPRACEVALVIEGFVGVANQSAQHESDMKELETASCNLGVLEACFEMAKRGEVDPKVTAACGDGDADACEALGKPIALLELCEAGDLDACDKAKATDVMCRAGFGKDCAPGKQRLREVVDSLPMMKKACEGGQKQACDVLKKPPSCAR